MKILVLTAIGTVLLVPLSSAETKVKMSDLPAAVQATVQEQTRNATLVGLSKEVEKGKTEYEIETKANGKSRDLMIDTAGHILSIEEEVDIAIIPAAARQAILKQASDGAVTKVELVTVGTAVSYEAAIKSKTGKKSEFSVNADGSIHR
jgi:uncharacterized membrane protein YkoI